VHSNLQRENNIAELLETMSNFSNKRTHFLARTLMW